MGSIKRLPFLLILVLIFSCCGDYDDSARLTVIEKYGPDSWEKQGLIKGDLYVSGIDIPLHADLETNTNREIVINNLLEDTYKFEYYVKPYGTQYWPTPRDTVFQIKESQHLTLIIK